MDAGDGGPSQVKRDLVRLFVADSLPYPFSQGHGSPLFQNSNPLIGYTGWGVRFDQFIIFLIYNQTYFLYKASWEAEKG